MKKPSALEAADENGSGLTSYLRFPIATRILHWIAAAAIITLLWSGFWIFNLHPRLYWGEVGYFGSPAIAELAADTTSDEPKMTIRIGEFSLNVTGILGRVNRQPYVRIFNFPEGFEFGGTRALHFTAAWILILAWLFYVYHLINSGRLRDQWLPRTAEMSPRNIGRELRNHLLLRRAHGSEAKRYNTLQKLSYLAVMFIMLPLIFLTGLTMSNSITTAWPWLFDLFSGRQSARTLHFVFATIIVLFILVHTLQVFVAGFVNHLRSMITGRFQIRSEQD